MNVCTCVYVVGLQQRLQQRLGETPGNNVHTVSSSNTPHGDVRQVLLAARCETRWRSRQHGAAKGAYARSGIILPGWQTTLANAKQRLAHARSCRLSAHLVSITTNSSAAATAEHTTTITSTPGSHSGCHCPDPLTSNVHWRATIQQAAEGRGAGEAGNAMLPGAMHGYIAAGG